MVTLQLFFQSREQVVVRRGQIRRIGWVIKILEAQVNQFLQGCKCPVSRNIDVREQGPLGDLPVALFLQNILQLHQQRWAILRVDSLVLWKIINKEYAVLIPKHRGENFSSGFLHAEYFGAGWAAMPPFSRLLFCLRVIVIKPGFVHGRQLRQEIIWIAPKKFQMLLRRLITLAFLNRVRTFRDPLRGELPHVRIFKNDGPKPLTWDA